MELTILMPCLNEAKTLPACIDKARAFLSRHDIDGEVLVADNGSADGSVEMAQNLGARVVHVPERGYGSALKGGIAAAQGRYIIMGDADDSYDFSQLEAFVEALRGGAGLVMGNRFRGGIAEGAMPTLHRYLGNPVLSWLGRRFFRIGIGDFHCGLRGFSRDAILNLGLVSSGMEFATEMVAKAALAGIRVEEVPTTLRPDGRDRPPHLRTWRDGWRHLLFMLLFTPRWLFLWPGLVLAGLGVVGLFALQRGSVSFAGLALDIHTLLYFSAATILGAQSIQFALLVKWLTVVAGVVEEPRWVTLARRYLRLELALIGGIALFGVGVSWSWILVENWREAGFSALNPTIVMRSAIPAVTLMVLGLQACAGALLAGAIHLIWRTAARGK